MIDQIEDKETKAKYIRKIMEQSSQSKNSVSLSNAYRFKDIMQQSLNNKYIFKQKFIRYVALLDQSLPLPVTWVYRVYWFPACKTRENPNLLKKGKTVNSVENQEFF